MIETGGSRDARIDPMVYLKERFPGEKLVFVPNPGNAGDSLIGCGGFDALQRAGLDFEECYYPRLPEPGRVVVYGGNGGLCTYYDELFHYLQQGMGRWKHLVLLPCTGEANTGFFQKLGPDVTIFAREEMSLRHFREHCRGADVRIYDDMAFDLDVPALLQPHSRPEGFLSWIASKSGNPLRTWWKRRRPLMRLNRAERWIGQMEASGKRPGTLNAFRTDRETTGQPLPADNRDVSALLAFGVLPDRESYYYTASLFMRYLNLYDHIRTDRLHVAIGGALLGKKVELFANRYPKCEEIFKYSLAGKFPLVEWKGTRS